MKEKMHDMYYVYILECKDQSLYTGITTNIERRLEEHTNGIGAKYTRGRGPFKLRYFETLATRSEATKRELEIKRLSREGKWQLIGEGIENKDDI